MRKRNEKRTSGLTFFLTLVQVVDALNDDKRPRVPYRDSKLTRFLQVRTCPFQCR